jgi:hypothetical protein
MLEMFLMRSNEVDGEVEVERVTTQKYTEQRKCKRATQPVSCYVPNIANYSTHRT